jgi:CBS domain-containing protein
MLAKDIMVREVVTLHPEDTLVDAAMKFAKHKVSGCPVVDEDMVVVGMLSEADILGHLKTQYKKLKMRFPPEVMFGISFEEEVKEKEIVQAFDEIGNVKVKDLMRTNVTMAMAKDTIESPVSEDGKLVGIVTRGDVIGGLYQNENTTPKKSS